VVYAFKPAAACVAAISLCGSGYDTMLALYARSNDWSPLQEVTCNDDRCGEQSHMQAGSPLISWEEEFRV
jgi:hypothetical protein